MRDHRPVATSRQEGRWRRWERKVWVQSREGSWGGQRVGRWGPGTGVLREGPPGGFRNSAGEGLGRCPGACNTGAQWVRGTGGLVPSMATAPTTAFFPRSQDADAPRAQKAALSASARLHDALPRRQPGEPPGKRAARGGWVPASSPGVTARPPGPASERVSSRTRQSSCSVNAWPWRRKVRGLPS